MQQRKEEVMMMEERKGDDGEKRIERMEICWRI